MDLPRPYLSYSALSLWRKDKDAYRRKYYEGEKSPETEFTIYGSEIHKLIEDGKLEVEKHPRDKWQSEVTLEAEVQGVPVLGTLDLFNPKTKAVTDIKTGIRYKDGRPRWNSVSVQKLDQLPFYQMLVRAKYGKVQKTAKLVWLETVWEEYADTIVFDGINLETTRRKLALTGKQQVFNRVIEAWEIDRQENMLVRDARAIQKDFYYYRLKNNV